MRTHLLAGLASLLVLSGAAGAADLRSMGLLPPAPELPQFYSWSGFYLGGQIGWSWDSESVRPFTTVGRVPVGIALGQGADRAVGGVHAGFNHQMGALVLGAEADLEAVEGRSRTEGSGLVLRGKRDWQASVRGRIGFALDRLMVYGTGGVAFADFNQAYDNSLAQLAERSAFSRTGWTAGGGVNYAFTDHVVIGLDYRYTDFGKFDHIGQNALAGLTAEHNPTLHTVRASLAYKF